MGEPRALALTCDDLGTLVLDEDHGYVVTSLDLGWPTAREVSESRVGADGEVDATRFLGARAVTMVVGCYAPEDGSASRREVMGALRAYAAPHRRPVLTFREDDDEVQQVRLRGTGGSWALAKASADVALVVQTQWKAADGILESAQQHVVTLTPVADAGLGGRTYPKRYPFTYPQRAATGSRQVVNAGDVPAAPVYRLWGPCTNPVLTNPDTGAAVRFGTDAAYGGGDLVLTSTQYAEVDVREATVRLNGRPAEPLLAYVDGLATTFAWLAPGLNRLRYTPDRYDLGARAEVTWRDAYL